MRKQLKRSFVALSGVFVCMVSIFSSCVKEEIFNKATVETSQIINITEATATFVGILSTDGGSAVTTRGFCWSTSPIPTIEHDTTVAALGNPVFSDSIVGLMPGTTYYVRAYAVNKGGVSYGDNEIFTTKTCTVTTIPISVSLLTATSAVGGGTIQSNGDSSALTVIARGVCWNSFPAPTIENSKTTDGVGGGRFTSKLDSLAPFTTYYVRAYVTNASGTIYGNEVSFTTLSGVIDLTTNAASSITAFTAASGGSLTSDGGAPVTERGLCWSTSPNPTTAHNKASNGSGLGSFSTDLSGLTPGTTYYLRSYGVNSVGTTYGNEVSFTTKNGTIELRTTEAYEITEKAAMVGGNITSDGGAPVTARGICWSTSPNPTTANNKTTDGAGSGTFAGSIIGLSANTNYYARSYGTNSFGTQYGNEIRFTSSEVVTDIDGNVYSTAKIGTQIWMVGNLKTTKYKNGTPIPIITSGSVWSNLSTPAYCWYNNDAANNAQYGALYNWHTINSGQLAPTGWHVPTDTDWSTLENYLSTNVILNGYTNGFEAQSGGYRQSSGSFETVGNNCYWWSSTENNSTQAWSRVLNRTNSILSRETVSTRLGYTVRCVKNQ